MTIDKIFLLAGIGLGTLLSTLYMVLNFKLENLPRMVYVFLAGNIIVGGIRLFVYIFLEANGTMQTMSIHIIVGALVMIWASIFTILDIWHKTKDSS